MAYSQFSLFDEKLPNYFYGEWVRQIFQLAVLSRYLPFIYEKNLIIEEENGCMNRHDFFTIILISDHLCCNKFSVFFLSSICSIYIKSNRRFLVNWKFSVTRKYSVQELFITTGVIIIMEITTYFREICNNCRGIFSIVTKIFEQILERKEKGGKVRMIMCSRWNW